MSRRASWGAVRPRTFYNEGMDASPLDAWITAADRALRALGAPAEAARPTPGEPDTAKTMLSPQERRHAAGLMRINHAGEIAAQALYHGQALAAAEGTTRQMLLRAAREEADHLAWCATRLRELDSRASLLDPLWYAGSFAIGALAGVLGDRISLGFVVETERQVEGHLQGHLGALPSGDARSRAIVEAMRTDEVAHGASAKAAGGIDLPAPVRALMRATARVMTGTAYWL